MKTPLIALILLLSSQMSFANGLKRQKLSAMKNFALKIAEAQSKERLSTQGCSSRINELKAMKTRATKVLGRDRGFEANADSIISSISCVCPADDLQSWAKEVALKVSPTLDSVMGHALIGDSDRPHKSKISRVYKTDENATKGEVDVVVAVFDTDEAAVTLEEQRGLALTFNFKKNPFNAGGVACALSSITPGGEVNYTETRE